MICTAFENCTDAVQLSNAYAEKLMELLPQNANQMFFSHESLRDSHSNFYDRTTQIYKRASKDFSLNSSQTEKEKWLELRTKHKQIREITRKDSDDIEEAAQALSYEAVKTLYKEEPPFFIPAEEVLLTCLFWETVKKLSEIERQEIIDLSNIYNEKRKGLLTPFQRTMKRTKYFFERQFRSPFVQFFISSSIGLTAMTAALMGTARIYKPISEFIFSYVSRKLSLRSLYYFHQGCLFLWTASATAILGWAWHLPRSSLSRNTNRLIALIVSVSYATIHRTVAFPASVLGFGIFYAERFSFTTIDRLKEESKSEMDLKTYDDLSKACFRWVRAIRDHT
ncbi:MAG: hypothetical protein Tsb0021_07980 [Chlamydiales bacterium]